MISAASVSQQSTAILGAMISGVTMTSVNNVERLRLIPYQRTQSDVQVVTHCLTRHNRSRGSEEGAVGVTLLVTSAGEVLAPAEATTDVIIRATTTFVKGADRLGHSTT